MASKINDNARFNNQLEKRMNGLIASLKAEVKRIKSNEDYLSNRQLCDLVHQMENVLKDARSY